MNPDFNFDAEGVFDEASRPKRPKRPRRKRARWYKHWIVCTSKQKREPHGLGSQMAHVMETMRRFDLTHAEVPLSPAYYHQVYMAEQRGEHVSRPGISWQRLKEGRRTRKEEVAESAADILARHDIDGLLEALDCMEAGDELTVMLEGAEVCTITRCAPDRLAD